LLFAEARPLLTDVPFDPHLDDLFSGEEVLLSARLFTHGFDAYSPDAPIAFHKYARSGEPRFWDSPHRDDSDSLRRVRKILHLSEESPVYLKRNLDRFGLGGHRTLEQFWSESEQKKDPRADEIRSTSDAESRTKIARSTSGADSRTKIARSTSSADSRTKIARSTSGAESRTKIARSTSGADSRTKFARGHSVPEVGDQRSS
jgi:hypothetical protein